MNNAPIQLPAYLQGLTDDTVKSMITNTGGVPRISIRGRQFRFIVNGEEIHKQTEPIHTIVLGVVPEELMAKTFYIHGYQPGSSDPPDCSSFFGIEPDSWVDSPQSPLCRDCPQNKWGSAVAMNGKKAKACKDSKRLMVINAKDAAAPEQPRIYVFTVTIASLKALSEYGKFLIANRLPMAAVITTIAFVDSEFPQVDFNFSGILSEKIGLVQLERAGKKEWLDGANLHQLAAPEERIAIAEPTRNIQATHAVTNQTQTVTNPAQTVTTAAQTVDPSLTVAANQTNPAQTINTPVVDNTIKDASTEKLLGSW